MNLRLSIFLGFICLGSGFSAFADLPEPNQTIVAFCDSHKNQKVGNGMCAALVHHALSAANASQGKKYFFSLSNKSPIVEKGTLADVLPGDVIVFRNAFFKTKNRTMTFGYHVAIIKSVDNENKISIYQQNYGGNKHVVTTTISINGFKNGWIGISRPKTKTPHQNSNTVEQDATSNP